MTKPGQGHRARGAGKRLEKAGFQASADTLTTSSRVVQTVEGHRGHRTWERPLGGSRMFLSPFQESALCVGLPEGGSLSLRKPRAALSAVLTMSRLIRDRSHLARRE